MEQRIAILERRIRALTAVFIITTVGLTFVNVRAQSAVNETLRVRQITVVDQKGVERMLIGAPLPDPVVQGKRVPRASPVSGVVVLDAKGNERGGFVTTDQGSNVFISLDSEREQEVLFAVGADGGNFLSFYDSSGNLARIGVLNGRPTLLMRNKGQVVFEQPSSK